MKQYVIFALLIFLQASISMSQAQSCNVTTTTCLHDGRWNSTACQCDCLPSYSGAWCQTANCTTQLPMCGTVILPSQCSASIIASYCPQMCNARSCTCPNGIDACLNNGTFNATNCTCACPSEYTGTVCETRSTPVQNCTVQTCENSGMWDQTTCRCKCFPNYMGDRCETVNCSVPDNNYCLNFLLPDCAIVPIVRSFCPTKCGRCPTTSG